MAQRLFKWKQVGKTSERLNRILRIDGFRLPNKFAPSSKDRSQSVDKVFNSSRSRLHSSLEITALNQTQEYGTLELDKVSKLQSKARQEQPMDRRHSTFLSIMPHSTTRNPTGIQGPFKQSASQLINDLKKEYLAFKKNILKELERQREMVQKMVKQIVLTMEIELQSIREAVVSTSPANNQSSSQNEGIKKIQEWKNSLKNVSLVEKSDKNPEVQQSFLREVKERKQETLLKGEKVMQPPKMPVNIDRFLGSFDCLQRKIRDLDKIFEEKGERAQPTHPVP